MLKIKGLVKKYGKFTAVDYLDLHVPKGEIYGFVGPNGAGKTTTMKIISGLMEADRGEVYVNDIDVLKNQRKAKEVIGYMPDFFGVYDDLKVTEYLDYYASIYKINAKERKKICDDLLELVDLQDKKDAYVDSLSRGMKQRLCLARSLVHNPELLVLDEPASGMDPRARVEMKEILRVLKDLGKTIIISSHILPELSELCTSIGIIERGKIVISGTVDEIMQQVYRKRFIKVKIKDKTEECAKVMQEHPLITNIIKGENSIEAGFEGSEEEMAMLLKELVMRDIPVISFGQMEGNLEDVFMKVTKGDEA
ncbi:ABC transporter ATP-binding protein [Lutispora thermophila]|uniref:ABC-2 type transport system ATP-binding protein n=1 Tax=Lutispora thermophila DSM 19022 TaxID=1122184 RepID=A0A1M6GDL7_9FIRM|nr:ABC transporter ATP-binding protein [Lutispora thermophila]SHJ08016.1 ABC-2 type transport system ATP-binding protein [Lutispora thermophila DSM 19022]